MSAESELASLASSADQLAAITRSARWADGDRGRLIDAAGEMLAEAADDAAGVGAAGASPYWTERAAGLVDAVPARAADESAADADTVIAVAVARAAIAQAALTSAHALSVADRRHVDLEETRELAATAHEEAQAVRGETTRELGYVVTGRPHRILLRLAITLGISLAIVVIYRVTGLSEKYDSFSALALFFLSAVVGSSICTNALCVDSFRVRDELRSGDPLRRILISKNLTMLITVLLVGSGVIAALTFVDDDLGVVSMYDQLLTMTFVWLGVGNVLSVVYPLRAEPLPRRFKDATWKAYLQGLGVSYVIGLGVNLLIYWQLWAKDAASDNLKGGQWGALAAVLVVSVGLWLLLSVLALACAQYPPFRRALSREMRADSGASQRSSVS